MSSSADQNPEAAWETLRLACPWPDERPNVPTSNQGWFGIGNARLLSQVIEQARPRRILELGSWTGVSTRFLCNAAPTAQVAAVDHWEGSVEHHEDPTYSAMLPTLYETFLTSCWGFRDVLVPIRLDTISGINFLNDLGWVPDLAYVDASHDEESVYADIELLLDVFPNCEIVGDDWHWETVRAAVERVVADRGLKAIEVDDNAWRLVRT
jgi:hypothetical protein